MNDLSLDELAKLSLGELATKFRQRGDTCALASMMFSAAMLRMIPRQVSVFNTEELATIYHILQVLWARLNCVA